MSFNKLCPISLVTSFCCYSLSQWSCFQCYSLEHLSNQMSPRAISRSTLKATEFQVNPSAVEANGMMSIVTSFNKSD